jgi:NADH-quinone oxidoreductase subunit M
MSLPALLLLAFGGAVLAPLLRSAALARVWAMAVMLAILAIAARIFLGYDGSADANGLEVNLRGMAALGLSLRFGVDGTNVYLLALTALLFPVVLACVWASNEGRSTLFLTVLLALEAGLLGTFLAQNLLVFFVLWEAVLIPMVLLILVYGGEHRRSAAMTFFVYTMAGSVLFLAAVIVLGVESRQQTGAWSFDFETLQRLQLSPGRQLFVFCAIALACAVKCPLVPFHAWLPTAYGAASAAGTALMAGVMSKMGAYGFIRLAIPLGPDVAPRLAPVLVALAVVSILYGALLALRQQSFKQILAYASLSHMGYIVLGVFTFQQTAVHGALFQILSHGVVVAGLFLLLGLLEQRCGPDYLRLDALATHTPRLATVLMLFLLASLALPATSGFTAEFLVLLGAVTDGLGVWQAGAGPALLVAALLAALGVVLGAAYMLRFARSLLFGDGSAMRLAALPPDLNRRETFALLPLLVVILWVGLYPAPLMSKVEPAVSSLAAVGARAGSGAVHRVSRVPAPAGATGVAARPGGGS